MRKVGFGLVHAINYNGKTLSLLPPSKISVVVVVLSLLPVTVTKD